MSALDNRDVARPDHPPAGAVAVANEEAVRAWDTVLYERWKSNRKVFVGALSEVTEDVFDLFRPPEQGRCIDIGCGFGETTQRLEPPQAFSRGIRIHDLLQLIGQEQPPAQQVTAGPAAPIFEKPQRLRRLARQAGS